MQFNEINDENITAETNCSHQIKAGGRNNNTVKAKRERERESSRIETQQSKHVLCPLHQLHGFRYVGQRGDGALLGGGDRSTGVGEP